MADDDDLNLDESSSDASIATEKSGGGGLIPMLLKWVAIGIGAIVIIFVLVWFAGSFIFDWGGNSIPVSEDEEEYSIIREDLSWYTEIDPLKVRTTDKDNPVQVLVTVVIGYTEDDKEASLEITKKKILIDDFLRKYFRGRVYEQLLPENEDAIRIEIRNAINDNILARTKIKDVRFKDLTVIPQ